MICIFIIHEKSIYKIWEKIFDTVTEVGLDALKTVSKIVDYKPAEATWELMGNKIAKKIVKPKFVPDGNPRNVEEIVLPPEKIQEVLHKLRHVL